MTHHRIGLSLVAHYLRRTPWESGRWRLMQFALPLSKRVLREHCDHVITTRHGWKMEVDTGDWLGRHVYVTGEYEPGTTRVIQKLLRPGDTFLDVGANIGYFTLLASHLVGPHGRVHAFEPMPATHEHLARNIDLNGVRNVTRHIEALSNEDGEADFYAGPHDHPGISSLRQLENDRITEVFPVPTRRLDSVLEADQPVDVIKIDVEGAEFQVLLGMREHLRRHRPHLILEVTGSVLQTLGYDALQLREWLAELGYQAYCIQEDRLQKIGNGSALPNGQYNALFTTDGEAANRQCLPNRS